MVLAPVTKQPLIPGRGASETITNEIEKVAKSWIKLTFQALVEFGIAIRGSNKSANRQSCQQDSDFPIDLLLAMQDVNS